MQYFYRSIQIIFIIAGLFLSIIYFYKKNHTNGLPMGGGMEQSCECSKIKQVKIDNISQKSLRKIQKSSQASQEQGYFQIPDFILTSEDGKKLAFSEIHEKIRLVYFGFTSCPEICPKILFKLSKAVEILSGYQTRAKIIFITIDPEHDTPEIMKNYLSSLNSNTLGLTGSSDEIQKVADLFGVYLNNDVNNHSTFVYLMHEDKYIGAFHENDSVDRIASKILDFFYF